jgi:hypothetical protein
MHKGCLMVKEFEPLATEKFIMACGVPEYAAVSDARSMRMAQCKMA